MVERFSSNSTNVTDEDQSGCIKPSTVLKTCTLELLSTAKRFYISYGSLI